MNENWIPIAIAVCLSVIAIMRLWLEFKLKADVQATIRKALDSGQHLSAELLDKIGVVQYPYAIDLRRAILLCALGAAIIAASVFLNILKIGLAISAFPIILAMAFFLLWKIGQKESAS